MHKDLASTISYQSNKWYPARPADNEIESKRNVYVYVLSMISIIYNLTLSLGIASRLDTVEELTTHLARFGGRAGLEPGKGAR